MKRITILLPAFWIGAVSAFPATRFLEPPSVETFPDGAVEWSGVLDCGGFSEGADSYLEFAFDYDLDGLPEQTDTLPVYSAPCPDGRLPRLRTFFPQWPGILMVSLVSGTTRETHSNFYGRPDRYLSIHSFCARPVDGEPEWMEIRNASMIPISLDKIRLDGKTLAGILEPGKRLFVTGDEAAFRVWRPGDPVMEAATWSYLRNNGDTLRLAFQSLETLITLDSILYGPSVGFVRETCGSLRDDGGSGSTANGSALNFETQPRIWDPRIGTLTLSITGLVGLRAELRLFDLDGEELCALGVATASTTVALGLSNCRSKPRPGTALLALTSGKVRVRKPIQIGGP